MKHSMRCVALRRGEWFFDPDDLLGGGGFGQVFFGRDASGNKVAVKRLNSSARECAHRELRVADEIGFEPLEYVLPVFDSGQDAESEEYFIVMPVAERSLQDDLDTGTIYSEHETAQILLDIVNGLSEVPEIVHRDLKPANVLISRGGRIKLTDFGIARPLSTNIHTMDTGNIVGTLPYLSPEQLDGKGIDAQSDIYALGITMYELLTGKRAFPQKEISALIKAKSLGKINVPLTASSGVPKQLVDIVNKAIETDKQFRYRDANEMVIELENFIRSRAEEPGYRHLRELVNRFWS